MSTVIANLEQRRIITNDFTAEFDRILCEGTNDEKSEAVREMLSVRRAEFEMAVGFFIGDVLFDIQCYLRAVSDDKGADSAPRLARNETQRANSF